MQSNFREIYPDMKAEKPDFVDYALSPFVPFLGGDFPGWYPRWSSGDFLVFLLSIFGMFVIFFYTSNLLADLIKKDFTEPINSMDDIIGSDRPYMSNPGVYWDYVQDNHPKLAEYARKTSGIFFIFFQSA